MKISLDASQRILQLDFEISQIIVANTNDFESKMTTRSNVTTPTTYGYGSNVLNYVLNYSKQQQ